jgi:hypothetical protein
MPATTLGNPAGPESLAPAVVPARVGEKLGPMAALKGCSANFFA